MAVIKGADVVGHVPRKISTMCSMFLRRVGSVIVCTITGSRRHSIDLVQGGMEVPCKYLFTGEEVFIKKLKRLLPSDISFVSSDEVPKQNIGSVQIKMEPKMDIDEILGIYLNLINYRYGSNMEAILSLSATRKV